MEVLHGCSAGNDIKYLVVPRRLSKCVTVSNDPGGTVGAETDPRSSIMTSCKDMWCQNCFVPG